MIGPPPNEPTSFWTWLLAGSIGAALAALARVAAKDESSEAEELVRSQDRGDEAPPANVYPEGRDLASRLTSAGVRNFSASELLLARRWGVIQEAPPQVIEQLVQTAKLAQTIRDAWGGPLKTISAYRSPDYNRAVKGASGSRHVSGMAIDLQPIEGDFESFAELAERICRNHGSPCGLGVYYAHRFVHVDTGDRSRFTRFK